MSFKILSFVIALLFIHKVHAFQTTRGIAYTFDGQQTLDLLMPVDIEAQEGGSRPAVIVIHGGGLIQGDRYEIEYIAEWFANQGFVVINVGYALAPENKWPVQLADVIQGVWWLKENAVKYNVNPDKILAVGTSAGGYLAAMLGQVSVSNLGNSVDSEIHGIVSFAGPWDFLGATTAEQVKYINLMLSVDTPQTRLMASPVYLISSHSPPVLIFHGTDDQLVPFQQSKNACEVYASKGLKHCFLIPLEGYTHALEIMDMDSDIVVDSIQEFLNWWLSK